MSCTDACALQCTITFLDYDSAFVDTVCPHHGHIARSRPIRRDTATLLSARLLNLKRDRPDDDDDDDRPHPHKQYCHKG